MRSDAAEDMCRCGHSRDGHDHAGCFKRIEKHDYIGIYRHGCPCKGFSASPGGTDTTNALPIGSGATGAAKETNQ